MYTEKICEYCKSNKTRIDKGRKGKPYEHWYGAKIGRTICSICYRYHVLYEKYGKKVCACGCGEPVQNRNYNKEMNIYKFNHDKRREGSNSVSTHGYNRIRNFNHPKRGKMNRVPEHILIMEKHIGRYLKDDEVVHHINDNKLDNRIENLQLMTRSEHISYHLKNRKRDTKGRLL